MATDSPIFYAGEIFAPDGVSQGSLDLSDAKDGTHARELAHSRGKEWLQATGFARVTIGVSYDGHELLPVRVSRQCPTKPGTGTIRVSPPSNPRRVPRSDPRPLAPWAVALERARE